MTIPDNYWLTKRVLVVGNNRLAASVTINFAKAGFPVSVVSENPDVKEWILHHLEDIKRRDKNRVSPSIRYLTDLPEENHYFLAVLTDNDETSHHKEIISTIEKGAREKLIIGVCTDYLPLSKFQKNSQSPGNVLGMNWAEPAHTTFFLELVQNEKTSADIIILLEKLALRYLEKDPYTVSGETGIRSKMMAALSREAFFLIDRGYARIEDIDRACRNDAGTYMPFAGNFRYMDLMGTYAYGVVMQELNKELSNTKNMPDFFIEKIKEEKYGMKVREGFFNYDKSSVIEWEERMRTFSYEIKELMEKYPFAGWLEEVKDESSKEIIENKTQ